jgi:hypothetical protein
METTTTHQLWSVAIRHNLSPNLLYFLDCCKKNIKPTAIINEEVENLIAKSKGLMSEDGKLSTLAIKILDEFETYLVKRKTKVTKEVLGEDFIQKVNEYREAWPKKRLPSGELARQSVQELKDKFVWFFKTYPEYDWNLVLDAADYYNIIYEKKDYMYMVTSSYFIKKTNPQTKETTSKLADYCQQILDNPEILNAVE